MSIPRKAIVISNCQCLPLAAALTVFSSETVFDFWGAHLLQPDQRSASIAEFVERAREEYELVLTIPLSPEFGALSQDIINTTFTKPVIKISNMYFSGYHPDLCYIGGLARRVVGPLSDYHSKICLYSYLSGIDVRAAPKLYRADVYHDIGYFIAFENSMSELRSRDSVADIQVTEILPNLLRRDLCFFSVNHPTSALFAAYSDRILSYLEERMLGKRSGLPVDPNVCAESLAGNCIFPIYPEIAQFHDIPKWGSYSFKPVGSRVNPIDLATFIEHEYATFSQFGIEALSRTDTAQRVLVDLKGIERFAS